MVSSSTSPIPADPKRVDSVVDEGFAYWHSATFNNDGTKVLFTDEWGGGCPGAMPRLGSSVTWGANAIYDIVDGKLAFKQPLQDCRRLSSNPRKTAWRTNGSIVPVPGRDLFIQAWYQGGISLIDFTDSAHPVEIAYFDRGPMDDGPTRLSAAYWSVYWYDGYGFTAPRLSSGYRRIEAASQRPAFSENEIAAAALADQGSRVQSPAAVPGELAG